MQIAFYAPLKPPDHPTPSGDRTMARALMSVLGDLGQVTLASTLRSRDGVGDAGTQATLFAAAKAERDRLRDQPMDAWVTYHNYYKAPDLIGPGIARDRGIPYVIVEASRATKRLTGPWAKFARAAEAACDAAGAILYLTEHDRFALDRDKPAGQRLLHLRPFLNVADLPAAKAPVADRRLLAVGMLRPGDKLDSFRALATALTDLAGDWHLTILGDGPARQDVEALYAKFGPRVAFAGAVPQEAVADHMRQASLLVWPGVNEAFGMVYLEAQAVGLRVIAQDRPGVRDVVGPTGALCAAGDPAAMARAIADMSAETAETIAQTRSFIAEGHLRAHARATLARALDL